MKSCSVYDAKTHLSRLLDEVETGEEVVITRHGRPIARLVREPRAAPRRFGTLPGAATVPDDFDAPLGIDELDFTRR